jgi:hypothetical protein
MRRPIARWLAIAALCVSASLTAMAETPANSTGLLCSLAWDGLVVGVSTERNVVAMYGKGFFDPNGGDTGARYYTDRHRSTTLAIEFGVDKVITSIVVSRGVHPPSKAGKDAEAKMLSAQFDPSAHPYPVALGMTKAAAAHAAKVKTQGNDVWSYSAGGIGCDRSGLAELTFDKSGKLAKIELSIAPDE